MTAISDTRPAAVTARGINGQITVDGEQIRIRKGLLTRMHGVRGERRVQLQDLAAVHVEPATDQSQGSLQLLLEGEDTATDERIVRFTAASAAQFDEVRSRLEALLQSLPAHS